MRLLLSIKPIYAHAIFAGNKKAEFRRCSFRRSFETVLVYATAPERRVIGEFTVAEIITLPLDELWQRTEAYAGLSLAEFRAYFGGKERGTALLIDRARLFGTPRRIEDFMRRAPQSFSYLPF